jgi:hypothetical protein
VTAPMASLRLRLRSLRLRLRLAAAARWRYHGRLSSRRTIEVAP